MLRFVYTYHVGKLPRDGSGIVHTVRIYRIRRNSVDFVCEGSDTFVDAFQLVLMTMEANRLLPKKAFERRDWNGHLHTALSLREAGIADIRCIT